MQVKRERRGKFLFSLTLDNCTVRRGERTLLSGLSLCIKPGDLVWLTGDNGIGKSSVLRLAAGLLRPEIGRVTFKRNDVAVKAPHIVSLLAHETGLHPALKVREELQFWIPNSPEFNTVTTRLGLTDILTQAVKTLSAGQKRRAAIARLIMSNKPIWLLDEPLSALDAQGRKTLLTAVKTHTQNGGAVMIATHHVPDALGAEASILNLSVPS